MGQYNTMHQGRVEIGTDGVAVALGSDILLGWLCVQAEFSNKEPVAVGSSTVTLNGSITDGPKVIYAKHWNTPTFLECNLADVYINGKKGDAITWVGCTWIWPAYWPV